MMRLAILACALLLSACGLKPMYAGGAGGIAVPLGELAATAITADELGSLRMGDIVATETKAEDRKSVV